MPVLYGPELPRLEHTNCMVLAFTIQLKPTGYATLYWNTGEANDTGTIYVHRERDTGVIRKNAAGEAKAILTLGLRETLLYELMSQ